MPRNLLHELLSILTRHVGHENAKLELRWMTDAAEDTHHLQAMVSRRARGEPLQYILGTQPFGPLNLSTRAPVLIPRPETEDWTLRLAEFIQPTPQRPIAMLDLCTGSGCIPLLLCHLWPPGSVRAVGADISGDAVQLAAENARLCGIETPHAHSNSSECKRNTFVPLVANIRNPAFVLSSALQPPFHLITSNPPYITTADYEKLSPSVKNFEDSRALIGDPDPTPSGNGLTFYYTIARLASRKGFLADNGIVAVEVGIGQAQDVAQIFQEEGNLHTTEIWNDPWDVQRVVVCRR